MSETTNEMLFAPEEDLRIPIISGSGRSLEASARGLEPRRESLAQAREYFIEHSDFPPALVDHLLDTAPEINVSPLKYLSTDALPDNFGELDRALVFVHMTDYFPEEGLMLPVFDSLRNMPLDEKKDEYNAARTNIHASLSFPVASHAFGRWDEKRFAVLIPFEQVSGRIRDFETNDMFVVGPTRLRSEAKIVGTSPVNAEEVNIQSSEELRDELMRHGVVDQNTYFQLEATLREKGIQTDGLLNERWELNGDLLQQLPPGNPYAVFATAGDLRVSRYISSPIHYLAIKGIIEMGRLPFFVGKDGKINSPFSGERAPWDKSGLAESLRKRFNGKRLSSEDIALRGYRIAAGTSPWEEAANIWRLSTGHQVTIVTGDSIQAVGRNNEGRVERAIEQVKPGGPLWTKMMKASWSSPRLVLYSFNYLRSIQRDLKKLSL